MKTIVLSAAQSFAIIVIGLAILCGSTSAQKCADAATCCPSGDTNCNQIRFDFEAGDLHGWQAVKGEENQYLIAKKGNDKDNKKKIQGNYFLDTLNGRQALDCEIVVIESPVFVIEKPEISFLVGGGSPPDDRSKVSHPWSNLLKPNAKRPGCYVALCLEDGTEVLWASGKDDFIMQRVTWDARNYIGKKLH